MAARACRPRAPLVCDDARRGGRGARRVRPAVRRQGRRARGRQGRRGHRRPGRGAAPTRPPAQRVVIEEFLDGPEVSLFALTDGATVRAAGARAGLQAGRRRRRGPEHRRHGRLHAAAVGAAGPGRRGASTTVLQPTVDEMARRGTPFAGLLYAGLALTSRGAAGHRVQRPLRRPGDPGRAGPAAHAARRRCCTPPPPAGCTRSARSVVATTPRSPSSSPPRATRHAARRRRASTGLAEADALDGVTCCTPAPRSTTTGRVVATGGRVLSVVGTGPDLAEARARAYAGGRPDRPAPARSTAPTSRRRPPTTRGRPVTDREVLTWAGFGDAGARAGPDDRRRRVRADLMLTIARGGLLPAGRARLRARPEERDLDERRVLHRRRRAAGHAGDAAAHPCGHRPHRCQGARSSTTWLTPVRPSSWSATSAPTTSLRLAVRSSTRSRGRS